MGLLPKIPQSPGLPPEARGPILPSAGMPKLPGQPSAGKKQPNIGALLFGFAPKNKSGSAIPGPQTSNLGGTPQASNPGANAPEAPLTSYKFTEQADYEKGFASYFNEKIKPVIRDLDLERQQKLAELKKNRPKANLVFYAGIAIGIGLMIWTRNLVVLFFAIALGLIIKALILGPGAGQISNDFKEKIIPLIVRFFGEFEFSAHGKDIDEKIFRDSNLFGTFNRSVNEDYIAGNYQGARFEFSETHLWYHSSGRNGGTTEIFKGMTILLEVNNRCQGKTVVKRESQKGLWSWMTGQSGGMKNVKFDNPDFEKVFEVYSSDENEAKTLITPDFIGRMMRLNDLRPNGAVRCCFFENKLLLAVAHDANTYAGHMFESRLGKNLEINLDILHEYLAQFKGVLDIIDVVIPSKAGPGIEKTI